MFYECMSNFPQGFCERYDELKSVLNSMKIPYDKISGLKILF